MLNKLRTMDRRGITLIELVVVVIILGLIAAIVMFSVSGANEDTATASCETDLSTVETAVDLYAASEGEAATSMSQLVEADYLRSASTLHTINASGDIVPVADSVCDV